MACMCLPYSRLFPLGANIPKFHELALHSGIYCGLLYKVQKWVAIEVIGMSVIK